MCHWLTNQNSNWEEKSVPLFLKQNLKKPQRIAGTLFGVYVWRLLHIWKGYLVYTKCH